MTVPASFGARLEAGITRGLSALPPGLQRLLGGPRPVRIDGQLLDPEVQLLLRLMRIAHRPEFEELPVPEAREEIRREAASVVSPPSKRSSRRFRTRVDSAPAGRKPSVSSFVSSASFPPGPASIATSTIQAATTAHFMRRPETIDASRVIAFGVAGSRAASR